MDILILILAIILLLTGLAGCILPVIPGPPVSFIGFLLLKFTRFTEPVPATDFNRLLWIFAGLALFVTLLDYLVPIWGTKKFGGSRAGTIGATLGLIVGLFFGPPGIILGPFIGAVTGELITGRDQRSSLRSGFGSFIGFLTGIILKLIVSGVISFYFIKEVVY